MNYAESLISPVFFQTSVTFSFHPLIWNYLKTTDAVSTIRNLPEHRMTLPETLKAQIERIYQIATA